MNEVLNTLQPRSIWKFFGEVLSIPRPSKKEDKIRQYLIHFAEERRLECHCDETGNVLIRKPAFKGFENRPVVILQSHMDMVCEKNSDTVFDFDQDAIQVEIHEGWLKAKGTTLGADNGIGVACQLAILDDQSIEHGPLECLFTVDEETGLTGAFGLKPGFLKGSYLLNLDSEDDGQFFIGCAGGIDTVVEIPLETRNALPQEQAVMVEIKGLLGGHSGDDINKGRANSLKLANRVYVAARQAGLKVHLAQIEGGNLRNAIPREAQMILLVDTSDRAALLTLIAEQEVIFKKELPHTEPHVQVTCQAHDIPALIFSDALAQNLSRALTACPHGVLRMDTSLPNFVETSTNLAAIRQKSDHLLVTTSQRSSVDSQKHEAAAQVAAVFELIGARVSHGEGYPGWTPNMQSPLLAVIMEAFRQRFNEEPLALAIHAGLECGLIGEVYPEMDMVSYGPTMRGVHSPDERLEIDTVERFWDLTLDVLKTIH